MTITSPTKPSDLVSQGLIALGAATLRKAVNGSEGLNATERDAPWPLSQWTEADLLAYVRRTARLLRWRLYHTRWSVGSDSGLPDLVLVRPPRVLFAELKTERGKLTRGRLHPTAGGRRTRWMDGQLEWLADLGACPGVEAYLWRPSDAQEIVQILQEGATPDMPCVRRLAAVLGAAGASSAEEGGRDAEGTDPA